MLYRIILGRRIYCVGRCKIIVWGIQGNGLDRLDKGCLGQFLVSKVLWRTTPPSFFNNVIHPQVACPSRIVSTSEIHYFGTLISIRFCLMQSLTIVTEVLGTISYPKERPSATCCQRRCRDNYRLKWKSRVSRSASSPPPPQPRQLFGLATLSTPSPLALAPPPAARACTGWPTCISTQTSSTDGPADSSPSGRYTTPATVAFASATIGGRCRSGYES